MKEVNLTKVSPLQLTDIFNLPRCQLSRYQRIRQYFR